MSEKSRLSINVLELPVVRLCLSHCKGLLSGRPVRIQSDNAKVEAYVNYRDRGGERCGSSTGLLSLAWLLETGGCLFPTC